MSAEQSQRTQYVGQAKRVVVKVGTSLLTSRHNRVDRNIIRQLTRQLAAMLDERREMVLVSSGAIGLGMDQLGLSRRPSDLPQLQACAAVGQGQLVHLYEQSLRRRGYNIGQVLLTQDGLHDRRRYLNARHTLLGLLHRHILPVVNENDTVAVEEIGFGDNDRLSALVAQLVDADLLVILTNVDGLRLRATPRAKRQTVSLVRKITADMVAQATGAAKASSTGGMSAKLEAARIANGSGIPLVIANGRNARVLHRILAGEDLGTLFVPQRNRMGARKRWLAFGSRPRGAIVVDRGAREALVQRGTSLLPSGVVGCRDSFRVGDCVRVLDQRNTEFARGLVNYSVEDVQRVKGLRSRDIADVLGHKDFDEVIHRDNLVLL